MVNTVFIIVVLLLELQKDCIHLEWPLGPRYNHTVIPCSMDIRRPVWVVTRLQLEPIGLVFLLFFMSILIIQVIIQNGVLFNFSLIRFTSLYLLLVVQYSLFYLFRIPLFSFLTYHFT